MARLSRDVLFAASFVAMTVAAAGAGASGQTPEQAPPAQAPATQTPPPQTPSAPRAMSPEQQAIRDALALKDPAGKLAALRKIQADYPQSPQARSTETAIFNLLVTSFKDREAEIAASIDKQVSAIPAAATPELRLRSIQTIVTGLVDNDVLLDRAESLISEALAKLDRAAYIADRRGSAERARRFAEERLKSQPNPPAQPPPLASIPTDADLDQQFARLTAGASELRGRIYLAKGDTGAAEREFKAAYAANPALARAPLELAKLAAARGDDGQALDYYLTLAASARLKRSDEDMFAALYRKVHGSGNIDAAIDTAYRERFPNPVEHPAKYTGPRTGRVALLEMFTGAACPPCVAADLALDAIIERYPSDAIAVLAYHAHIPGPDPMVVPGSDVRRLMYEVPGVPTFNVDGSRARVGGGARENTPMTFDTYVRSVDKAVQTAPEAELSVTASLEGPKVIVKAAAAKVRSDSKDLRLHIVLAEKHLTFSGENGIRFHPFVVRDVAGEKAGGFQISDRRGVTNVEHVFDLTAIPDALTRSLADDIARRRKDAPPAATPREFRAEGRAMAAIDPTQLVVVAFVQDAVNTTPPVSAPPATPSTESTVQQPTNQRPPAPPTYKVLQAAWTPVSAGTR